MRAPARQLDGDDLPGRPRRAAPVLQDRRPAGGGLPGPPLERLQARRPPQGDRDARPRRHPAARPSRGRLPAPVLRRHAPARDDRDGPDQRPVAADRRRADHRARRDGAGADPRPAPGPAARVQLRRHHHHPRPRRHRRDGRRRPRDVRRPLRGVRHGQADPHHAGDALHVGPAVQHPRRHRVDRRPPDPDPRQPAQPAAAAVGLFLPPPVRALRQGPRRPVPHRASRAAAGQHGHGPSQALPPRRPGRGLPAPRCCPRSPPSSSRRPDDPGPQRPRPDRADRGRRQRRRDRGAPAHQRRPATPTARTRSAIEDLDFATRRRDGPHGHRARPARAGGALGRQPQDVLPGEVLGRRAPHHRPRPGRRRHLVRGPQGRLARAWSASPAAASRPPVA